MKHCIGIIAGWMILAGSVHAHSFNVTMIVPAGEAEAALQAFLIASAERDSHPDETSDGHLGGVDSHVSFVQHRGDAAASLATATATEPDILVVITPANELAAVSIAGVWILPVRTLAEPTHQAFLSEVPTFATDTARRVYVAARLIDIAVRAQDGVDDIAALASAIINH